jgi:hypothetical protein
MGTFNCGWMSGSRADFSQHGEKLLNTPQHTCAHDVRRQGISQRHTSADTGGAYSVSHE